MKRFLYIFILLAGCKEAYNPPIKNANNNYLVVEGVITAENDSTIIHLSRTTIVSDTSRIQPEVNANITVEGDGGDTYQLQNKNNGTYSSAPLHISLNGKYRLHIFTVDGKEYASDYVPVIQTPPIDSVSWSFNNTHDIDIDVSTQDASNSIQYYRWQYDETWEHRAVDSSVLVYENGALRDRLPEEQIFRCWKTNTSSEILIASTSGFSSSVIYEKPLVQIPYGSEKINRVYSLSVTQFALTKEGFEYWQNLKKNTEQLGGIFDPQPFAEFGNIHCITNPDEPVIGFISACSASQQRIYIYYTQLNWPYTPPDCVPKGVAPSQIDNVFSQSVYLPLGYGAFGSVIAYQTECLDCRLSGGGTTVKPPYMP